MFNRQAKKSILLGRWSTILKDDDKDKNDSITFNIDSANHDHCGSELCKNVVLKKTPNTKNIQKRNFNMSENDMFPYII